MTLTVTIFIKTGAMPPVTQFKFVFLPDMLCLWIFICVINSAFSARILGFFPIPSLSHQVVFRAYTQELAKRGHELVIITPNPALPKNRPKDNVTEIDVSFSYDFTYDFASKLDLFKRGVIADVNTVAFPLYNGFAQLVKEDLMFPEVKKILEDKNQHFDLIVTEAILSLPLILRHFYKAPVIQISSFHGLPENYETVGGLTSHPVYYPNFNRNNFGSMSYIELIKELYYEFKLRYEFWKVKNEEDRIIKELYGPDTPTVDELKEHVDLLFVNIHSLFANNRPVPPSVVYLGALHLLPLKKIPQDLKYVLDNSKRGVIYVSLGSNVLTSNLDKEMLDAFLNTFKALPYDVLWKCDGELLRDLPDNVIIRKWFPQRDMLVHPNIKVFVTQGGLQSTDEAIDAGVPLVGIPMLGDQFYNVHKYVELGIGVKVDSMTITAEELTQAVKIVAGDDSYKQNIRQLRSVMRDQKETPLERAVWYTEHLLRHGNARHLRARAANVKWTQYFMLDFFFPIVVVVLIFCTLICYVVLKVQKVFKNRGLKVKLS